MNGTFRAGTAMCCRRRILECEDSIASQSRIGLMMRHYLSPLFPSLHVTVVIDFDYHTIHRQHGPGAPKCNVLNNHNSSYSFNSRGRQRGCRVKIPPPGMLQRLQPIQRKDGNT